LGLPYFILSRSTCRPRVLQGLITPYGLDRGFTRSTDLR
jgi:hypothetical protein